VRTKDISSAWLLKFSFESLSTETASSLNGLVPGGRPLHVAVSNGNSGAIKTLLELGVDTNLTCVFGNTPLHHAARFDRCAIASKLLEGGAAPNAIDRMQRTPLMIAARNGATQIVSMLMELGYNPRIADCHGQTALHHAAQQPNIEVFTKLLNAGWDPYQLDNENRSSICYALSQRSLDTFVYAHSLDLSHLCSVQDGFQMPLLPPGIWTLRQFLGYASTTIRRQYMAWSSARDIPPLIHYAITEGQRALSVCIEAGADLEVKRHNGDTAVLAACRAGVLSTVAYLVHQGARLQYEDQGRTFSVYRAAYGRPEIIEWLLVNRWTDQPKLASEPANSEEHTRHRAWTGVRTVMIPLRGDYTRPRGSSLLDHAEYLHRVARKGWRILVPLGWDTIAHLVQLPSELEGIERAPQHSVSLVSL